MKRCLPTTALLLLALAVQGALVAQGAPSEDVTLTEGLRAYPAEHYRVARFSRSEPADHDGDGLDDVAEFLDAGRLGPFNPMPAIDFSDGTVSVPDRATFEELSYEGLEVRIDTHLQDLEFVKFYLLEMNTDAPQVYFMNTVTHRAHGDFSRAIGISAGRRWGRWWWRWRARRRARSAGSDAR